MGENVDHVRFAAFYGLLVVEWRVSERLDAELQATAGLSLNRLELLAHLHFKDGRRRMSDLADALLLSRGGATRLVARAEADGQVRREIPPDDRRGMPVYEEIVQRLFHDFVGDDEAEVLVRVWKRVLDGNDAECAPITQAAEALEARRATS